jgi:hypothetical protein
MSDRSSGKTAAMQSIEAPEPAADERSAVPAESDRLARLIRTVEGEIVPRLLVSLSGSLNAAAEVPSRDAVCELARLLLVSEDSGAADLIRIIHEQGMSRERICLGLIAPAARRLGELWERKECNFDQLMLGLSRLESVLGTVT